MTVGHHQEKQLTETIHFVPEARSNEEKSFWIEVA
jgi:hypothetical protein